MPVRVVAEFANDPVGVMPPTAKALNWSFVRSGANTHGNSMLHELMAAIPVVTSRRVPRRREPLRAEGYDHDNTAGSAVRSMSPTLCPNATLSRGSRAAASSATTALADTVG